MIIYSVNLGIVTLFSFLSEYYREKSRGLKNDGTKLPLIQFTFIVMLSLTLISGLRFFVGTDYLIYVAMYADIRAHGLMVQSLGSIEVGYRFISWLFGQVFVSPFAFLFVVALFTQVGMIMCLRRHAEIFWMSCVLYIMIMTYYSTFNIIRQTIAATIVFIGHRYIVSNHFKKYLLVVLIGSLFHSSSLVMIPVYFLANSKAWSKRITISFFATIILWGMFPYWSSSIMGLLAESSYSSYTDGVSKGENGANMIRMAVSFMPALLGFMFRKRLVEKFPEINIAINMVALKFFIMLFSMKDMYFARLGVFMQAYLFLLLPCVVKIFDDKKTQFLFGAVLMVMFGLHHYLLLPTEGSVVPYRTIFEVPWNWSVTDRMVIW